MALINLTLQGKGGVGKSYIASLLAQYYRAMGRPVACFDTDPVNQTFAGYKAFAVETIRLGERADEVNARYFDGLVEKLMAAPEDGVVVIDSGASTFLPLLGYLVEGQVLQLIADSGHQVRLHAVLTGGQALEDTALGLHQVLKNVPATPIVIWLNEYFGRIERQTDKGPQGFETWPLYRNNQDRIHALVRLPEVRKDTFGHDIGQIMQAKQTFDEACASTDVSLMARQRLRMTWRSIQATLDQAML